MARISTASAAKTVCAILLLGATLPAHANERLLARLEKLNAGIISIAEVTDEAVPALESLKKSLSAEAKKVRASKVLADELEQHMDLLDIGEESLEGIREQLGKSAIQLRELKDLMDSLDGIMAKTKDELARQEKEAWAIRKAIESTVEGKEKTRLEGELARAEAMIASQSATIRKLQAGGAASGFATSPAPATGTPPAMTVDSAFAALQSGDLEKAGAAFEAMLANDPSADDAAIGLASCAFARGEMDRAREMLNPLLDANRDNPRALGLLGALLCDEKQFKDAREALERAVEIDEDNPYYFNYLGVALWNLKKRKDAVQAVERAVELDPYYLSARFNLSVILASSRRPDLEAARIHYEQYLALGGKKSDYIEGLLARAAQDADAEGDL